MCTCARANTTNKTVMKKIFVAPVVEIKEFQTKDVIATSEVSGNVDPSGENYASGLDSKLKGAAGSVNSISLEW